MLNLVHQGWLILHVLGGCAGLLLFWVPMLSRKGSALHRKSGNWYSTAMTLVAISAAALSTVLFIDPVAAKALSFADPQQQARFITEARLSGLFLAQLAVMLFVNLQLASRVLQVRGRRELLRTRRYLMPLFLLLLISLSSGVVGLLYGKILLPGFALVGMFTVMSNLRYLFIAVVPAREWLLVHVRNIIPSGIAAYTAFFVVGVPDWMGDSQWRLLPWVLPGVIGGVFIFYYSRQLRVQIGSQKARGPVEV